MTLWLASFALTFVVELGVAWIVARRFELSMKNLGGVVLLANLVTHPLAYATFELTPGTWAKFFVLMIGELTVIPLVELTLVPRGIELSLAGTTREL